MQRGVVLFLVALCVLAAQAKTRKSHRHAIHRDLESLEKRLDSLAAEEEEELHTVIDGEELAADLLENPDHLLAALDCGSSGTKVMIFATSEAYCPWTVLAQAPISQANQKFNKQCPKYVKFLPTMSKMTVGDWERALQQDGSGIVHDAMLNPFKNKVKYVMAMATAGNRIIAADNNMSAWQKFTGSLSDYDIQYVEAPKTIPGTHEAWLEFKSYHQHDFMSMGGASAQAGFKLDQAAKTEAWATALESSQTIPACNNQQNVKDFFAAVDTSQLEYVPVGADEFDGVCGGNNCVGLMSWLGSGVPNNQLGECPSSTGNAKRYHYVGGMDQVKVITKLITATHDTCWAAAPSRTAPECIKAMVEFSRTDESMKILQKFVSDVLLAGSTLKPTAIGSLGVSISLYKELTDQVSILEAENLIILLNTNLRANIVGGIASGAQHKAAGTAVFMIFGFHGLLQASGLTALPVENFGTAYYVAVFTTQFADADWIAAQAREKGFNKRCSTQIKSPIEYQYDSPTFGATEQEIAEAKWEKCEILVNAKITKLGN